jgi:thiol-disulfide isomerase/thioredoxin
MRSAVTLVLGILLGLVFAAGVGAALYGLVPATSVITPSSPPLTPPPATPAPTITPETPLPTTGPGTSGSPGPGPSGSPGSSPSTSPSSAFPLVGKAAPPLAVPQVGGGSIDLANLRGSPVWVVFTGTYCPPCRDEYPLMNGFAARYGINGLIVIGIHVKEDEATVGPFVSSLNITFPVGLDADGSKAQAWGALALPLHYFVDAKGVVRDAAIGGLGPDQMARSLRTILPGVDVKP